MNLLLTEFVDPGTLQRRVHIFFCTLWVVLGCVYLWFAHDAHALLARKLPRAGFHVSIRGKVQLSPARLEELLNSMADKYDSSMAHFERSLAGSARTRFRVDATAAILCLAGLAGQLAMLRRVSTSSAAGPTRRTEACPQPTPAHEGSFPGGGYAL